MRPRVDNSSRGASLESFDRWTFDEVKDDTFSRFVNRVTMKVFNRLQEEGKGRGKMLWSFGAGVTSPRRPIIFVLILARRHVAITSILLNY